MTPTAHTSAAGPAGSPAQPLGRDVGERPGHVADRASASRPRAIWARPKSRSAHGRRACPSASRTFAGLTSRWTIPRACACASASSIWRAASTARAVVELAAPHRLAQRLAGDVLVGDVDVLGVAARSRSARRQRWWRSRAAASASRSARDAALPSRGDDLQRDVEARLLVAREPDRAGAAAAERPQRPVAAEDELALEDGGRRRSTSAFLGVGQAADESCPAGRRVRVTAA